MEKKTKPETQKTKEREPRKSATETDSREQP